ncbi:MAG TPA: DUF4054 domain-containing protein [Kofleriaceae bacterium]|nr:DUF4054 domain-containing protein [Kofleriaceae bacterium]
MAWTAASYKAAFPEFAATPDAQVTAALNSAALRCDSRLFGATIDDAVALLAGHLLSISPSGQQSRLDSDSADTTYYREWLKLAGVAGGGPWLAGMAVDGTWLT